MGSNPTLATQIGSRFIAGVFVLPTLHGGTSWALPTDKTYTGQRSEGFELLDYNARYYNPALGRFISADTIIPEPGDPMSWDRYGYVLNNPIKYADPSGHWICEDDNCSTGLKYGLDKVIRNKPQNIPNINGDKFEDRYLLTIDNYVDIRNRLALESGYMYVNRDGCLKDEVLIALIIALEFGNIKESQMAGYGESLEALSEQFFSTQGHEQSPCFGSCSFTEQLIWLQTFQGIRQSDTISNSREFEKYLSDSVLVMDETYRYGRTRNSWSFGNASPGSELANIFANGGGKGTYCEEAYFFGGHWSYICSAQQCNAANDLKGW